MGSQNPLLQYREIFGEMPPIMEMPSDPDIMDKIEKAVAEKKELWTYYFDKDPAADNSKDI